MDEALLATDLPLDDRRQGKVRDIYHCQTQNNEPALLIVATDRVSAFDVVMSNGIPGKGAVLTQISTFWFDMIARHFGDKLQHHLISTDPADVKGLSPKQAEQLEGRVMIGRRANVGPIERALSLCSTTTNDGAWDAEKCSLWSYAGTFVRSA